MKNLTSIDLDISKIKNSWRHSHEESSDSILIFRNLEFAFPPSRGRVSLSFEDTEHLSVSSPGATDVMRLSNSKYHIAGTQITIEAEYLKGIYDIIYVNHEILILKKIKT